MPIPNPLPRDHVLVYHTHGYRQYTGTCKLYLNLGCPHLVHWRPGRIGNGKRLGKMVMREFVGPGDIGFASRCKTCWPEGDGQ